MNEISTRNGALATVDQFDYVLVDGSGSMQENWWNFLQSADVLIDDMKKAGINSQLVVHVFDSGNIEMVQRDCPISQSPSFKQQPLASNFMGTPLYDAINLMGRRIAEKNPEKASILIVTDGGDTSSVTSVEQAGAIIKWLKAKGWQVTFLGYDFNNTEQARLLGASEDNTIAVQKKLLTDAVRSYAQKREKYSRFGDKISFSDDERKNFGGYLTSGK